MAATTSPSDTERLDRFDRVERAAHWTTAILVLVAMATAATLYIGALSAAVGRRELMKDVHVLAGLAIPVPLLIGVAGRWGGRLRTDLSRLNRWSQDDLRWLRSWTRDPLVQAGKFNPGQKLNAAFTAGAVLLLVATGSIMRWFGPFPLSWRTGATFVHDWVAVALFVTVAGHIVYALRDGDALRSMVRGWIPASWARRHAPAWVADLEAPTPPGPPAAHSSGPPTGGPA